ncbi:DnaB-like helicase C-terminal domain-containing protein [Yersinia frederiksenii]|uniref:DnaB-like helicase C-terminal domain-containing protein n=1 Tax=Yersinia frederiksenii TaxID=29484 RepID=UPI000BFC91E6|nr:DnaB-like helicase C-terminal domain-containing protein [Yersinia frederiksenii]ATM86709.1 helicase DnaB [Yersinia frederiksenii]
MTIDYKTPPHNLDAEQSVLGGLMLDDGSDNVAKVLSMLKPESFYTRPHQVIFAEIKDLVSKQIPIDLLTIFNQMENKGISSTVGGFAYMAELSKYTPSAANIVHYAMEVRDKAITRYSIAKTNAMTELLYANNGMTATQKLEAIQALSTEIADHAKTGNRRGLRTFESVFSDWVDVVEQRLSGDPRAIGLTSGIASLDAMLEPKRIVKGSLFVVGARPKMGKTTLYLNMAINCAMNEKLPALAFSLEMPDLQLAERMITQISGVSSKNFYLDGYDDNRFALASAKGVELATNGNLYIDDTPGLSLAHIVSECRRIKRERGVVGMVLVDYLTLMKAEKADRNDLAYGMITKGLKNLAKELDCVVVLLTQLNRDLEKRTNKRPLPSDSRDTGQIEQDCDYWLGIYRAGAYDDNANQHDTELLMKLNRHGENGVVYVEQRFGAIYDCDQTQARAKADESDRRSSKQQGGF